MKLSLDIPALYRVKRGQTVRSIARTFGLPPRLLAAKNSLTEEVYEGQLLAIPRAEGNLYVVRGGETKALLCGSAEKFSQKNCTDCLYVGQTVVL